MQKTDPDPSMHQCPCTQPLPPEMIAQRIHSERKLHSLKGVPSHAGAGLASGPARFLSDSMAHRTNLALMYVTDRQSLTILLGHSPCY